jgi:hypothetical protein
MPLEGPMRIRLFINLMTYFQLHRKAVTHRERLNHVDVTVRLSSDLVG